MSKKQSKTSKPVSKKASNSTAAAKPTKAGLGAVVTTTAPDTETTAAPVTVAPAAKVAKVAKGKEPAVPREERNGVKRPKAEGACGRVWAHLDAKGDMSVANIRAWAASEGLNPNNASIEIYQWRRFNGIKAVKVTKAKEVAQAA